MDQRPRNLRKKSVVNRMELANIYMILKLQKTVEKGEKDHDNDDSVKEGKQKTFTFKKQKDNGRKRLHPARFLALPIHHPRKWAKKVPKKRTPFVKNKALEYTGTLNSVTDQALKKLHNRCKPTELKHFYEGNLNIASKKTEVRKVVNGTIETSFDLSWTDPSTVGQVQEAIINYGCALHTVWPTDATALIMMRVLINYKWLIKAEDNKRAGLITKFFNNVAIRNANRACNNECPLSYAEQETVLKGILLVNHIRPEVPIDEGPGRHQQPKSQFNSASKQQGGVTGSSKNSKFAKAKDGRSLCYGNNDMKGGSCQNKAHGNSGCKRTDGLQLAHLCNAYDVAKKDYCLGAHRSKHHR